MSAIASTAAKNESSFAFDGLLKPLIFLTNWSEAARISSAVTGGSRLNRGFIFLHIQCDLKVSELLTHMKEAGLFFSCLHFNNPATFFYGWPRYYVSLSFISFRFTRNTAIWCSHDPVRVPWLGGVSGLAGDSFLPAIWLPRLTNGKASS